MPEILANRFSLHIVWVFVVVIWRKSGCLGVSAWRNVDKVNLLRNGIAQFVDDDILNDEEQTDVLSLWARIDPKRAAFEMATIFIDDAFERSAKKRMVGIDAIGLARVVVDVNVLGIEANALVFVENFAMI